MSQVPPELAQVYAHIDENIDQHVVNLQKWIQQPSISNSGEGIPESAEMVKGFFDELGCQQTQVYDPGITEYGSPSNPVVYAKCDEGAEKTVLIYWMYDTMPVTQADAWHYPPFEAQIVEQAPYKKVMIGRGAYGRPWWPGVIANQLDPGSGIDEPSLHQEMQIVAQHHRHMLEVYGPDLGNRTARKHIGWTITRLQERNYLSPESAAAWRQRLLTSRDNALVAHAITQLYRSLEDREAEAA